VLVALAATSTVGPRPASGAPERAVAATGGCRAVGSSDAPTGGGPNRATVVVDTGSGPVWSACVSFSGTISGIEALDRAASVITDLDPVYDQYGGIGRAVCKLRGVGTPPPDCLGKSVNYWSLSVNGKVSPVGAGAITIRDGDVEGWRHGTGGLPRAATEGTEAAEAPPAPTTTKPPATTTPTSPPAVTPTAPGGGSMTGSTKPDGTPADPTTTRPGETTTSTTEPGQTTTTKAGETTTTSAEDDGVVEVAGAQDGGDGGSDDGRGESASAASASSATAGDGDDGSSSSLPAALGFAAVIAAIGGGTVLIRRRNASAQPPLTSA
jgi:hypothetical protein